MWDLIVSSLADGNPILLLIALSSFITVFLFVERWLTVKRASVDGVGLLIRLSAPIERGDIVEALHVCEEVEGALPSIFKAGLEKFSEGEKEVVEAMEIEALLQMGMIEQYAHILSLIAHIVPLLGLLGTVIGFIQAFGEMRMSGLMDTSASKIGEAMEAALLTTAAGLAVAIPTVFAYNVLVSRIRSFGVELEVFTRKFLHIFKGRGEFFEKGF